MSGSIGSGSDTITLKMSQDPDGSGGGANGAFTLNVDGQQIGGVQTISAQHSSGQDDTFTFQGNYAPGSHAVTVTFVNNNGTPGDPSNVGFNGDRNIYVDGVTYDGQTVSSSTTPIYESPLFPPNGPLALGNAVFNVNDTTPVPSGAPSTPSTTPGSVDSGSGADTLTLQMAEDPYNGDAQFNVAVDGKQVGGTFTTTAVVSQGQQQAFNLHGDWGSGGHTVAVSFLNDAIGGLNPYGSALDNQDRNLYVLGVNYDGVQGSGTPWEQGGNGSHDFYVPGGGQPSSSSAAPASSTSDNATITTSSLTAGQTSDGSSIGMSFVASPSTSSTSSDTTGSGAATTPAVTVSSAAPTTQDLPAPVVSSSTDTSTTASAAGAFASTQPTSHVGGAGFHHHHG